MTLFNLYFLVGFCYMFYLWSYMTPEEDKQLNHLGDVTSLVVQVVGGAIMWPMVVFVNHVWKGPEE